MVNSRSKGNRYELTIARHLSVWWTGDKSLMDARADSLPFRRTPGSGGWDKRRGGESDLFVMDDGCSDFPYGVECKNQQAWEWDHIFKSNGKCPILAYWDQCVKASEKAGRIPLLLMTKNNHPTYVIMTRIEAERIMMRYVIHWVFMDLAVGYLEDLIAVPRDVVVPARPVFKDRLNAILERSPVVDLTWP